MPLHLARDGGHREGHELLTALGVEALDRVQQPDRAGLHQVVVLRAVAIVPVGERLHQRHVELDQTRARALVPTFAV